MPRCLGVQCQLLILSHTRLVSNLIWVLLCPSDMVSSHLAGLQLRLGTCAALLQGMAHLHHLAVGATMITDAELQLLAWVGARDCWVAGRA